MCYICKGILANKYYKHILIKHTANFSSTALNNKLSLMFSDIFNSVQLQISITNSLNKKKKYYCLLCLLECF